MPQPLLSQLEGNKRRDCSFSTVVALTDALGLSIDRLAAEVFGGGRRGEDQDLAAGEMIRAAEAIDAALGQTEAIRQGLQTARNALRAPGRRRKR